MLDALYEQGIIPIYSFPRDVVSTYIEGEDGKLEQQVDRGLDIAISEYAPGRANVVNRRTCIVGGLYRHIGELMIPTVGQIFGSRGYRSISILPSAPLAYSIR